MSDKQKIIIENDNLYVYMNRSKKIGKNKYIQKMDKIMAQQKCVDFLSQCSEEDGGYKVKYIERITSVAKLGKEHFITAYFDNGKLKGSQTKEEKIAIIAQLFEWEIACKQDDESGILVIENF
ncbi:MAG TPA: hypothetical protein VK168_04570 [Saprospiraceae bacterium]|nr:hypothetical protein [Saprospiraceae bacterium]